MIRKSKLCVTLLSIILATSIIFTGCSSTNSISTDSVQTNSKKASGSITVWTSLAQTDINSYIKDYNLINPNVKVNAVSLPGDSYMTKLRSALASGVGTPDVMTFEIKDFGVLKDTPFLENLSMPPYNVAQQESNMIPYVAKLSKDSKGNFKGLSFQSCPGGFWYNKALAKKYLGTDDPTEVGKLIFNWSAITALSKTVSAKSGGKIHLFDSIESIGSVLLNTRKGAYVDLNNKLYDKQFFINIMKQIKDIRTNDGDAKLDAWTAPWSAAFYNSQRFILLGQPSWGLQYCIKANTPKDAINTSNSWGLVDAPSSYESGGTWFAMYSKSTKKAAAWDFIKTINLNKQYLEKYVERTGDMISYIPAINDIIKNNFRDKFTGDQAIYQKWLNQAQNIKINPMTQYDSTIETLFYSEANIMLTSKITPEAAVAAFEKNLKDQFPEIIIN